MPFRPPSERSSLDRPSIDDIQVVFEDDWLLAVNKPAGLVVHGARDGHDLETLLRKKWSRNLVLFHRLDQDTTGIVLLGKRADINRTMTEAFEQKKIRKCYMAVVEGRWASDWNRVETYIDRDESGGLVNRASLPGKKSLTTFRVLRATDEKSWIEAIPKTGRTHQIRLHCLEKGRPILGDRVYGRASGMGDSAAGSGTLPPQALHAYRVDFTHPATKEPIKLLAPPPEYWATTWLKGLDDDGSRLAKLTGL